MDVYNAVMELDAASFKDGLYHTKETREAKWEARKKLWETLEWSPTDRGYKQYLVSTAMELSSKGKED